MKELSDVERDLIRAAKAGVKILSNSESIPADRAIEMSRVIAGLAAVKADLELIRSMAVIDEQRIFSRLLKTAEARSMEERFSYTKGQDDVLKIKEYVAHIEAKHSECRSLMAAFKHGVMTFRGMMGMKE